MSTVNITPTGDGQLVTPYKNKPEYGWIKLRSETLRADGGWLRTEVRSCLLRAKVEELKQFVKQFPKLELPGKIWVREFVQSEVPEDVQRDFYNKDLSEQENADLYAKTTGGDEPIELTLDAEQILRFSLYDASGKQEDIFVQHDNGEEVREHMALQRQAKQDQQRDEQGASTL